MKISIWRLIHLWLAMVSAVFLLIASVTGVILAAEPVYEGSYGYDTESEDLTVAQMMETVRANYSDVISIQKTHNAYFQINVFGEDGEESFYIDPRTGERAGELFTTPGIFDFARTLHRSLFFKETGRFLVGMTSLVTVLLAIAGFFLVVRKQGGITLFFKKVIKESFHEDYHTRLGKLFIWPILAICVTGTILFLVRFDVIHDGQESHSYDFPVIEDASADFSIFENTTLDRFSELVYPFTDMDDDYYELKLTDAELLVNQKYGIILSRIDYSQGRLLSDFSFRWHTGEGQPWWAILLGISSLSMLFFMYTGLNIYLQRSRSKSKWLNPYPAVECDIVIAVGSETGLTAAKAGVLQHALLKKGKTSFITSMNNFKPHPGLRRLIVMTSTYGKGDAPTNAGQFIRKINDLGDGISFSYAVAGFGSRAYPDFCAYALAVDKALENVVNAEKWLPVATIEESAPDEYTSWLQAVETTLGVALHIKPAAERTVTTRLYVDEIRFSENPADNTFLIALRSHKKLKTTSGDLLAVTPADNIPRYYSMSVSKDRKTILLSVKKYPEGVVSGRLAKMKKSEVVEVTLKENAHFHFPQQACEVMLIANGTGIGPFLGMIESNTAKVPVRLFWGGRDERSFALYKDRIEQCMAAGRLLSVHTAYSRVGDASQYVQDLVKNRQDEVGRLLTSGGVIMLCGSLKMQQGVEQVLDDTARLSANTSLSYYKEKGQIRADCY